MFCEKYVYKLGEGGGVILNFKKTLITSTQTVKFSGTSIFFFISSTFVVSVAYTTELKFSTGLRKIRTQPVCCRIKITSFCECNTIFRAQKMRLLHYLAASCRKFKSLPIHALFTFGSHKRAPMKTKIK